MSAKTRRALLYIFMSLFILTMFTASLTFGRYYSEQQSQSDYNGDFEYIVSDAIEVSSIEEFFIAVENGYSNIKIDDEVDNPLVISGESGNLSSDLTIDLNGHELQRNNRDPLLNVPAGINLTIIDSKGGGSLYNPVGSVLRADGGTITVAAGIFESGPRSTNARGTGDLDEYAEKSVTGNNEEVWKTGAGATISETQSVTVYQKQKTDGNESYNSIGSQTMPVIVPEVTPIKEGDVTKSYTVNGNMYFEQAFSFDNSVSAIITNDTYVYFTIDSKDVENTLISANNSADYYYEYYMDQGENGEYSLPENQTEGDVKVTIYIYNNVKSSTENTQYSAIDMERGNLYVRGGTYYSYFGKENTYCVNASGGYMSVAQTSDQVPTFNAYENGVCVACSYADTADTDNEYLNISAGSFYSEVGDTIFVSGGRMEVANGAFNKVAPVYGKDEGQSSGTTSEDVQNLNGSAIHIDGGTLTVSNSIFTIKGDYINGIFASATQKNATVKCADVTITFNEVYNEYNNAIPLYYNYGIYSKGGTVECEVKTELTIVGNNSVGILLDGGSVNIANEFTCDVAMSGGDELSSAAIYAGNGNINFTDNNAVNITSDGLGVVATGGNIYFGAENNTATANINIKTTRGTAIYVSGLTSSSDSAALSNGSSEIIVRNHYTLNVIAEMDSTVSWAVGENDGLTSANIYNGIYVRSGSFTILGTLNVDFKGIANTEGVVGSDSMVKSYAVRVDGSEGDTSILSQFTMSAGEITVTNQGGGIYVNNGTVTIDSATINAIGYGLALRSKLSSDSVTVNNSLTVTSQKASAIYITGGSLTLNGVTTVNSKIDSDYINGLGSSGTKSYDGVFVENGSITSSSSFTVNFTGVPNDKSEEQDASMVKSYAVRVDGSKNTAGNGNASFKAFGNFTIEVDDYLNQGNGGGLYVNVGSITIGENVGDSVTATINATGYGLALRGQSSTDNIVVNGTLDVTSSKASGIYITGGSLTLNGTTTVNSTIDENYINSFGLSGTPSYDGIFVEGGSLTANGALNVTFTGMENEKYTEKNNSQYYQNNAPDYAFLNQEVKSYAVKVLGGTSSSNNVTIKQGIITNSVGGGIYVGGGTVTLGEGNLSVTTTGDTPYDDYNYIYHGGNAYWGYKQSMTGGHAVEVVGGTLTVKGGTYSADLGNGILVRNLTENKYTVTIDGGEFVGKNSYSSNRLVGPGAYVGLYIMGRNMTVDINGGTFGIGYGAVNGSASFYGTPGNGENAIVNIYKGNFYSYNTDAVNIFRYMTINFGKEHDDSEPSTSPIQCIAEASSGDYVAVSFQDDLLYTNNSGIGSKITIWTGNFVGANRSPFYPNLIDNVTDNTNQGWLNK